MRPHLVSRRPLLPAVTHPSRYGRRMPEDQPAKVTLGHLVRAERICARRLKLEHGNTQGQLLGQRPVAGLEPGHRGGPARPHGARRARGRPLRRGPPRSSAPEQRGGLRARDPLVRDAFHPSGAGGGRGPVGHRPPRRSAPRRAAAGSRSPMPTATPRSGCSSSASRPMPAERIVESPGRAVRACCGAKRWLRRESVRGRAADLVHGTSKRRRSTSTRSMPEISSGWLAGRAARSIRGARRTTRCRRPRAARVRRGARTSPGCEAHR